ncbi:hydroxymethylbilane synthase [Candidatus Endowatersipora endosymbiont of Watersipora subatra]|uniref:hydroxymethylbilane synthase n=1 Tax=Candidatus Endowatersipora endosymbiont of Watersipora subatra TaxID=3077946 RepID=UPI00312CBE98
MIRIATRRSKMALAQTESVCMQLRSHNPVLEIHLSELNAHGDKDEINRLDRHGGKGGAFVSEIREELLLGNTECAMHSLKDVPGNQEMPGLIFAAFLMRDDPTDALVLRSGLTKIDLERNEGDGIRIGTNSVRRAAFIRHLYRKVETIHFRGAVDTRIRKMDEGIPQKLPDGSETSPVDALLLSTAGLIRLGLEDRISHKFSTHDIIPAVGQGIVVVECVDKNWRIREMLSVIDNAESRTLADAEREVLWVLNGHCNSPIAAHATIEGDTMTLRCAVMSLDGRQFLQYKAEGAAQSPRELGREAGLELIHLGAKRLIDASAIGI